MHESNESYICDISVSRAESSPQPCAVRHVPELRIGGVDILVGERIDLLLDPFCDGFCSDWHSEKM